MSIVFGNRRRNVFNPCIEEGQAFTGHEPSQGYGSARARTCSVGQVDGDSSACNSGDDSDYSGKEGLLDNETAASAAIQARATTTTSSNGLHLSCHAIVGKTLAFSMYDIEVC